MSYGYQNAPPPPQQYGGYPQQPQYSGQAPYPQGYPQYGAPPPGQYPPPPGQYGAPPPGQYGAAPPGAPPPSQYSVPPPGQYGAPPPGQYGAPPPGQYGAPPPPGQYNSPPPPGPYGAPPPPQPYAPQALQPGQWGQQAPQPYTSVSPQPSPSPQPQPQPQPPIKFRFSAPGKGILNSSVIDQWGRTGWTISSPSKKETFIKNQGGTVVGRIEWHSSPKLDFLGYQGKTKVFMPRGKAKHSRVMRYNKQDYDLLQTDGVVRFHPRFAPQESYVTVREPSEVEISPQGLALGNGFIEHAILVTVLYHCGHGFGDVDMDVMAGVWGASAGAAVAVC